MKIYYFTGTGNSFSTAIKLSGYFPDCTLVPFASLVNLETIEVKDDIVGFVYPIYGGDMPLLVRNIIERMKFLGKPYIFAVTTSGGNPTPSEVYLARLLHSKGQTLSFQRDIYLPGNMRVPSEKVAQAELNFQDTAIMLAAERINERKFVPYATDVEIAPSRYSICYSNILGLKTTDKCSGCGTCAAICPMNNIKITNGQAIFGESCTSCAACFHWCPNHAVIMTKARSPEVVHRNQYHHPDVTLQQILNQK